MAKQRKLRLAGVEQRGIETRTSLPGAMRSFEFSYVTSVKEQQWGGVGNPELVFRIFEQAVATAAWKARHARGVRVFGF